MVITLLRKIKRRLFPTPVIPPISQEEKIANYIANGRVPWSEGYAEHKYNEIKKAIQNPEIIAAFREQTLPANYGYRIDERIVEYPWIFSQLSTEKKTMLDAGSTFNFEYLLDEPTIANKHLFIHTYYPESPNFNHKRISYVYGDLRELPYQDNFFEEVVCQSTIEHIDMDNSIYGYDISHVNEEKKSYEYLKVVEELLRVLKSKGVLLLTFPYGKFENHGFFQQFDEEMLKKILHNIDNIGNYQLTFFCYSAQGWSFCSQENCKNIESFNPHTGRGKGNDGAAHCRSICCIKFIKN